MIAYSNISRCRVFAPFSFSSLNSFANFQTIITNIQATFFYHKLNNLFFLHLLFIKINFQVCFTLLFYVFIAYLLTLKRFNFLLIQNYFVCLKNLE